jgi:hypothetical protein
MADLDVMVMVDELRRSRLGELAKSLEAKGLRVTETLPRFRTILGRVDSARVAGLSAVEGVEAVRPQRKFQLPPMREDVPQ